MFIGHSPCNKLTVKPTMNEAFVGLALMDFARLYGRDKT